MFLADFYKISDEYHHYGYCKDYRGLKKILNVQDIREILWLILIG
jgi:hypothetical protein